MTNYYFQNFKNYFFYALQLQLNRVPLETTNFKIIETVLEEVVYQDGEVNKKIGFNHHQFWWNNKKTIFLRDRTEFCTDYKKRDDEANTVFGEIGGFQNGNYFGVIDVWKEE